jgi:hypothetical protein
MANVTRSFMGDMMIVRASASIPANTELKIWYRLPSPENQPLEFSAWNFACDCSMCVDINNTDAQLLQRRIQLRAEIAFTLARHPWETEEAEKMVEKLEATFTRPLEEVLRFGMWDPRLQLADAYHGQGEYRRAGEIILIALREIGFGIEGVFEVEGELVVTRWGLMPDGIVHAWLILGRALMYLDMRRGLRAEGFARLAYKIAVGEDETFVATYGSLMRESEYERRWEEESI